MNKIHAYMSEKDAEKLIQSGKYDEALSILLSAWDKKDYSNRETLLNNISLCYLNNQDYENASKYLEKIISLDMENTNAVYNLGYSYYVLKKYQKAIDLFEDLKKKEKTKSDLAYTLGLCYLNLNIIDKAMESFHCLLDKAVSPDLIYNLGITLISLNYPEKAKDIFIEYLAFAENDIDATFGLGIAYSTLKEYRKAIECYRRVVLWNSERYISAYVSMGMAYFQIGDLDNSLINLNQAIRLNPQMTEAWYYLGVVYESTEQIIKAISAYQRAGNLDHTMVEVWEKLALLYLKIQNLDDAKISLKKAFKLTDDPKYAYKLALVAMVKKDYKKAVEYFIYCLNQKSFQEVKPVDVWESLSLCYYYIGDYEKSIDYGQKVLEKIITKDFICFVVGSSYMKLGKMRDAKIFLSRGLNIQPEDANLLYSMGILEGNLENFEGAEQYLDKALIIHRSPDIIYALALTKMKLKENCSAAKLFEEYQSFNSSNPDVLYKLGLLFIELKDYDKAKKAFQETLALRPENERAKEYLRSLEKKKNRDDFGVGNEENSILQEY